MSATLIGQLLPPPARVVEADDTAWESRPHPDEEASLGPGAVAVRRREFAAGRHCARRALTLLGLPEMPIPRGPDRAPRWPDGVTGSVTHCADFAAAAVAWRSDISAVGIDAEVHAPLPDGVVPLVCHDRELQPPESTVDVHWPTVVFSAKESLFKAWFPVTGRWLEFADVELVPAQPGVLIPRPRTPAATDVDAFEIRFHVTRSHVFTVAIAQTHLQEET